MPDDDAIPSGFKGILGFADWVTDPPPPRKKGKRSNLAELWRLRQR